jgi:uncharacterized protein YggE
MDKGNPLRDSLRIFELYFLRAMKGGERKMNERIKAIFGQGGVSGQVRQRKVVLVLALVAVVVFGWLFKRAVIDRPGLVTVVGEGRVKIKPEMVKFTLIVQNISGSATVALSDNNRLVRDLIEVLKGAGVKEEDIELAYVRIIPPQAELGQTSFQAVNSAQVTLRQIAQFDNLVVQLYSRGATSLTNIIFTTQNSKELEKQAVELAIKDAKQRGKELAKVSGKWLGRMVSLTTAEAGEAGALSGEAAQVSGFTGAVVSSPSQIQIIRQASVVFELR